MAEMKLIVQKIDRIEDHFNADKMEIAYTDVFDWPVVIGLGNFKPGDKCVHFPVDCVVDPKMERVLMGDSKYKLAGGRIRALNARKVISYGILCPWDVIKENYPKADESSKDLMKVLGCKKYEPPQTAANPNSGNGKKVYVGANPNFEKYTSLNHLQAQKGLYKDSDVVSITEKLHGTSARYGWVKRGKSAWYMELFYKMKKAFGGKVPEFEFVYGSRNVQLQNRQGDGSLYSQMVEKYDLKKVIPLGYSVYGEIVGPKIQANYKYTDEPTFHVYDIKRGDEYVNLGDKTQLCRDMKLTQVPSLGSAIFSKLDVEAIFKTGSTFPNTLIEGVVIECGVGHKRKKSKVINPKHLLKKGNTDYH
ncbi:MAG: hypothetical protein GY799_20985 [Desulfobulbaceae bacterium]|nr:hypothetical protein [Desulfobulbaceae bacterium]